MQLIPRSVVNALPFPSSLPLTLFFGQLGMTNVTYNRDTCEIKTLYRATGHR